MVEGPLGTFATTGASNPRRRPAHAQHSNVARDRRCRGDRLGREEIAGAPALRADAPRLSFGSGPLFALPRLGDIVEIRFDRALKLDRHRPAVPVEAASGDDADPAFRDRIFENAGLFLAVELDPDAPAEQRLVIVR